MGVDQFIRLQPVIDVEKEIESAKRDLKSVEKLTELRTRKRPQTPNQVQFDNEEFQSFLADGLEGISLKAMRQVREHVSTVLDKSEGQKWLAYGLAHVADNLCPYCQQDLADSPIASAYADFFSAAFKKHMLELRSQETRFLQVLGPEGRQSSLKSLVDARDKALAWMNDCFLDVAALSSPIEPIEDAWAKHAETLRALVARKLESPTDPIACDESVNLALAGLQAALGDLENLRSAVHEAETQIAKRMVALESMKPQETIQRLALLQNTEKRYQPEVARVCGRVTRLERAKKRIDGAKERERNDLNQRMDALLTKYKEDINGFLEKFGTRIRIVGERVDHRTRQPKVEYKLQVAGHEVDLGDGGTVASTPCLGNTLSDGDKNSLALSFFLAHLKRCDLASTIVVIDDPVTSLDRHRRGQTCNEIVRLARECRQVIVLTHEPRLARALWKATPVNRLSTLATIRQNGTNALVSWDMERGTADRYFRSYLDLCKYVEQGGDPGHAVRQLRQLMEGYLRRRFPGRWSEKIWLGTMLGDIRNAGVGNPLRELQGQFYDELADINDLTKQFHHDDGADTEDDIELDDASALPVAIRALNLLGTCLPARQTT
jgi:wobble nucleotide-excising tRNase